MIIFCACLCVVTSTYAQVSFAIVCNTALNELEIVVEGRKADNQKILKSGFPNQAAAEAYKENNANNLQCGIVNRSAPSSTSGVKPSIGQQQNQRNTGVPPSRSEPSVSSDDQNNNSSFEDGYAKSAILYGGVSQILNADEFYFANGAQNLGINLGLRVLVGKKVKGGLGVQYTTLLGLFEPVELDFDFGSEGLTSAIKLEALGFIPFSIGTDKWIYISPIAGFYFNHMTDLGLSNDELFPALPSTLLSGGIEVGVDLKGLIIGAGIEVLQPINELSSSNTLMIKLITGVSF